MLGRLVSDTRLHQTSRGPWGRADQQRAIYKAARGISLGGDLRLSGVRSERLAPSNEQNDRTDVLKQGRAA